MADVERAIEEVSKVLAKDGSVSVRNAYYQVLDARRNLSNVQIFLSTKVDSHLTV